MTAEQTGDGEDLGETVQPLVLLFGEDDRNRRLLAETLGGDYRVRITDETAALGEEFACCLVSQPQFASVTETIAKRQADADVFLPVVLLVEERHGDDIDPGVWEYVDDVMTLPVKKRALTERIRNLVERRRTALELAARERELQATVEDLRLKERAIDEAPVGFTIADATAEDDPLIYGNEEFERITEYSAAETYGRNCRFLQGEETNPGTVARIHDALRAERPVSVDIVNYRKGGEKFWNSLNIAPLRDGDGEVTHYVGFQTDITDRKVKERRREVLNRVLSHNLRNKMNVIEAYIDILDDGFEETPTALENLDAAAENLLTLAEKARETDRILTQANTDEHITGLDGHLQQLVATLQERYPDVTITLETPDEGVNDVAAGGLLAALGEGIDNAAKHNGSDDPTVSVRVGSREGWLDIDIEDNGPGIPDQELDVLEHGEDALRHADRMGIWLIYWTVTRAGGTMKVVNDPDGTRVTLSVPEAETTSE